MIRKKWIAAFAALMLLVAVGAAQAQETSPYRLGIGLGVPYGGIGLNAEMSTESQFVPTVGVGSLVLPGAGLGWTVGARYYLDAATTNEKGKPMGLRLTLLYGTNTFAECDWLVDEYKALTGITLGFGKQWQKWNLDLLFEFPVSSVPVGYTKSTGSIDLSFGYMF